MQDRRGVSNVIVVVLGLVIVVMIVANVFLWNFEMNELDWEKMLALAMDPEKAREYRESSTPIDKDVCTMCGDLCAVKRSRMVLEGK